MSRTIITPPGRWNVPDWRELWEAREVFWRFGQRDVVLRYRQTAIGVIWVLLQPLVSAGVFALVFGAVAGLGSDGVPYFLFSYISMLAWNLFSQVVSRASGSLVANQALVAKVFFPRMLVPLSTVLAVLLDFAVALGLGVVLLVIYGVGPGLHVLAFPAWTAMIVMVAVGVGLAAAAVMVKYRDVAYVVPWFLQIGLYATPVAYALSSVPESLRIIFLANPLSWLLEGFRSSLLGTPVPSVWQVVGSVAMSVLVLVWGVMVFQAREREMADLI